MRLARIEVTNYARLKDLDVSLRGHLVIVGANDVGKTSLLRLLNLLFGTTAQLYQSASLRDLRDAATPLVVKATFVEMTSAEKVLFPREIDVDPHDKTESLEIRLEVSSDPDDPESVVVTRWCPGRGEVRTPTRDQLLAFGWRYLPAIRTSSASQLEGSTGAIQTLLKAVEPELGSERTDLARLMETFNEALSESTALSVLREGIAKHLSNSMPRNIDADGVSIRTSADPSESVLENASMFFRDGDSFVPLSEQSDGIKQLIAMTLFDLAEGAANVIAIDEPEIHLHPLSQRTVAELLKHERNQKILVTHSPYIVQKFDPVQVLAINPDGQCHQIDPARLSIEERTQAHWWSPRMLEALTARFAILVEGVADRLIVEAAARAGGISLDRLGAIVFELGGAENFPTVYKLLGPDGFNVKVLGLVDKAESAKWIGAVGGKPKHVVGRDLFVSDGDLEDEYCRALGAAEVARRLIGAGIAQESGILASTGATSLDQVGLSEMARFCRASSKSLNRKVPAALAVSKTLSAAEALQIDSVASLLARLKTLASL